uniref:Uncharacterized protein n=1 Tax=Panthera tigris altaica TaxID=74533 RepID=A0A8C9JRT8_PANTA
EWGNQPKKIVWFIVFCLTRGEPCSHKCSIILNLSQRKSKFSLTSALLSKSHCVPRVTKTVLWKREPT